MLDNLIQIAYQAGQSIQDVTQLSVQIKQDQTPVTQADIAAHQTIHQSLKSISDLPIISEEAIYPDYTTRKKWDKYWLIDPLDGTKEFIAGSDEFTVNIALIENRKSILGVVYAPEKDWLYAGSDKGAFCIKNGHKNILKISNSTINHLRVATSKSHDRDSLPNIRHTLEQYHQDITSVAMGSSLKLCAIAENTIHLYPRLAPTSEWDTAAGQAVLEAAGGSMIAVDGVAVNYNKEDILNPHFYAYNPSIKPTIQALLK